MTRQLVKKSRTDKRKRKGYKGSKWDTAKRVGAGVASTGGGILAWDAVINAIRALAGGKDGGRVRGVGKATHGYGRAMRKKK